MRGLHFVVPRLGECVNQVRPGASNLIVHLPGTRQLASTSRLSCLEGEQRDNVPRVSVEDLFISRVGRAADDTLWIRMAEVLHMREHHVCELPVVLVILAPSLGSHVGGDTTVDDNVLLSGVLLYFDAANHEESVPTVQFVGQPSKLGPQGWEREGFGRDVAIRKTKG